MTDLYISYSMRERHWVSQLVSGLESEGYSVWWEHVAVLGETVRPDSQTALNAAKQVLVIWSTLATEDHWVLQDAEQAQASGKLVSVLYKPAELPTNIDSPNTLDLKQWRGGDTTNPAYLALIDRLKEIVKPSQQSESQRKQALKARKLRIQAEKEFKRQSQMSA